MLLVHASMGRSTMNLLPAYLHSTGLFMFFMTCRGTASLSGELQLPCCMGLFQEATMNALMSEGSCETALGP